MYKYKPIFKILILLVFVSINKHSLAQNHSLTIEIPNIKKAQGVIEIGLFTDKKGFPKKGKQQKKYVFKVNSLKQVFKIKNISEGEYAVAIYHDKNTDGECNRNLIGIPKEPYGFSNNYKPLFSAPDFKDCLLNIKSDTTISINLLY